MKDMLYKNMQSNVLYRNIQAIQIWIEGKFANDFKHFGTLDVDSCFIVLTTKCDADNDYVYFRILTSWGILCTSSYKKNDMNWFAEKVI